MEILSGAAIFLLASTAEPAMMRAMSEQPIICDRKPLALEVEAGTHWWCSCGRSSHQPFCDGSHKGTGMQPVKIEVDEKKTLWWCQCKHTANPPLCDGSHKQLKHPD